MRRSAKTRGFNPPRVVAKASASGRAAPTKAATHPRPARHVRISRARPAVIPSPTAVAPVADSSVFKVCTHTNLINRKLVQVNTATPLNWHCHARSCDVRSELVVCLTCGYLGCGREQEEQHGLKHFEATGHALTMGLNSGTTFCYKCNEWVLREKDKTGSIKLLMDYIEMIRTNSVSAGETRHGTAFRGRKPLAVGSRLPFLSKEQEKAQEIIDRLQTAAKHHEATLLRKVLAAWCDSHEIAKQGLSLPSPVAAVRQASAVGDVGMESPKRPTRRGLLPGRTGLRNLGNTCFINSVVQALSSAPPFRKFFLKLKQFSFAASPAIRPVSPVHIPMFTAALKQADGPLPPPPLDIVPPTTPSFGSLNARQARTAPAGARRASLPPPSIPANSTLLQPSTAASFVVAVGSPPAAMPPTAKARARATAPPPLAAPPPSLFYVGKPALVRQKTTAVYDEMNLRNRKKRMAEQPSLCLEMSKAMRLLWSGKWAVFTPAGLVYAVWKFMPFFRCYQQQDAQEFFTSLLDCLHEELRRGGVLPVDGGASTLLAPQGSPMLPVLPLLPPSVPATQSQSMSAGPSGVATPTRTVLGSLTGSPPMATPVSDASMASTPGSGLPYPRRRRALGPGLKGGSKSRPTRKAAAQSRSPAPPAKRTRPVRSASVASARSAAPPAPKPKPRARAKAQPAAKPAATKKKAATPKPKKAVAAEPKPTPKKAAAKPKPMPKPTPKAAAKPKPKPAAAPKPRKGTKSGASGSQAPAAKKRKAPSPMPSPTGSPTQHLPRFPPSTFVKDTLFGSTQTLLTCSKCKRASPKVENFTCLSVDVDVDGAFRDEDGPMSLLPPGVRLPRTGSCDLHDSLRKLTAVEILDGDERYFCDHCNTKRRASRRTLVHSLPRVFVIHVNRARWLLHGKKEKLQQHVAFPLLEHLDMTPYATGADSAPHGNRMYDLASVVCHHGRGIDTGHYTAFCRDSERDVWLFYNDDKVRVANVTEVAASQAYLLFYTLQEAAPAGAGAGAPLELKSNKIR